MLHGSVKYSYIGQLLNNAVKFGTLFGTLTEDVTELKPS